MPIASQGFVGKTTIENYPDMPTHEQKELSKCNEMVSYPAYRISLGEFEVY